MLVLYHGDTSVCAAKVRMVLDIKELAFESRLLDLAKGENLTADYLALNPYAVVPTLVDDGVVIRESTLINEYLDDLAPDPPLRPEHPAERFAMRLWTKRLDDGLHNAVSTLSFATVIRHQRPAPGTPELATYLATVKSPERRALLAEAITLGAKAPAAQVALALWREALAAMAAALERGEWLAGSSYSLADIAYSPYMNRLELMQLGHLWSGYPAVAAWWARARAQPAFARAVAAYIPAQSVENYRRRGLEAAADFASPVQDPR